MTYDGIGIVDCVAPLRYVENIITNFKKELSKGIKNLNSFKVILLDYPHIKDNSPALSPNSIYLARIEQISYS